MARNRRPHGAGSSEYGLPAEDTPRAHDSLDFERFKHFSTPRPLNPVVRKVN